MGPQMGPMLALWTLLSGTVCWLQVAFILVWSQLRYHMSNIDAIQIIEREWWIGDMGQVHCGICEAGLLPLQSWPQAYWDMWLPGHWLCHHVWFYSLNRVDHVSSVGKLDTLIPGGPVDYRTETQCRCTEAVRVSFYTFTPMEISNESPLLKNSLCHWGMFISFDI